MKTCPRCKESKPLSEYGINRARKDGIHLYCRLCACEKSNSTRQNRVKIDSIVRKRYFLSLPIWRMQLKPKDAVLLAIKRGAKTQIAIQRATRLYTDEMCDALADLWAEDRLNREALKRREYRAA